MTPTQQLILDRLRHLAEDAPTKALRETHLSELKRYQRKLDAQKPSTKRTPFDKFL